MHSPGIHTTARRPWRSILQHEPSETNSILAAECRIITAALSRVASEIMPKKGDLKTRMFEPSIGSVLYWRVATRSGCYIYVQSVQIYYWKWYNNNTIAIILNYIYINQLHLYMCIAPGWPCPSRRLRFPPNLEPCGETHLLYIYRVHCSDRIFFPK